MLASPPAGAWFCVGEKTRYKCQQIFTPDCLRIAMPLQKGLCLQPQAWESRPLQGSCVCGWRSWDRERVGSWFGAVGVHTARPEMNQPVEPRQGVRPRPPAEGQQGDNVFQRSGLLPAPQSCWGEGSGGGGCLLGNLEGTKNQIKRRLLPALGRLISVRSSLS